MSKDIKALLKEAREAIKNKEFQTSLKLCKTILKEDKENYMALVFFGLSLQETGPADQAPKAFRKAIQCNATNVLAWNGLASYYEKIDTPESKVQLVEVYTSLLDLNKEEKKQNELCEKLLAVSAACNDPGIIAGAYYKMAKNAENGPEMVNLGWSYLILYLSKLENVPSVLILMYEEALKTLINNSKTATKSNYSEYLKLLHKQNKHEALLTESLNMSQQFPEDKTSLEWFCKTYNTLAIEGDEAAKKFSGQVNQVCETLLSLDPQSTMGQFTKALLLYENNNFTEAKDMLEDVTSLRPGLLYAWVLLCNCYLKLHFYGDGAEASKKADRLLQSINNTNVALRDAVDLLLIEFLSKSNQKEHWNECSTLCEKILEKDSNSTEALTSLIRSQISLENYQKAEDLLSKLKSIDGTEPLQILLQGKLLRKQGNNESALNALQSNDGINTFEYWLEVGTLFWEMERYSESLVPFLKAAKLDPNSYLCFLYLGNYYQKFNNFDKARRCYEKAFRTNPKCQIAGIELSRIYRKLKNWDANLNLLQSITGAKIHANNKWAYLQLGLHYMEHEEYSKAVDSLRLVVRHEPGNSHYWEALADAYIARGAFNSALKCYQKAMELEDNALYPLLQVANIKKLLSQYQDARTDFETILKTNKKYVPALKGLAETCMNQARYYRRCQLIGRARDCAQDALDNVIIALEQKNDISCLWKIAADSSYLVAQMPQKNSCMLVLASLVDGSDSEGNKILEQNELFTLAERCYYKALTLVEDNVLLWHDLAACYYAHARHAETPEESPELFKKARACVEHCISVNPTYWQHWNLLGTIAFFNEPKNYALAQHSYIKAVTLDHNSAVAWCNLGSLYLHIEDIKLANKAFSQAQRADPTYVNSWVGQALLAESVGLQDAMDLFRHSTQLIHLQESALGYGHWVCKTILDNPPHTKIYSIHNMHAVPVALDALTWYTENNPENACAWNMLGLLRERMGLKSSTAQAFKNAVSLADPEDRDKAYTNYGRALMRLGQYKDAIDLFRSVKEATFSSVTGLALALFKDEQFEESYETYESALHWMTDDKGVQSALLVALASMVYLYQGAEGATTLLFQSTQCTPRSPWGLYATLSLGLLHDDLKLANLVLKEFQELRDDKRCLPHIAVLTCYTYMMQNQHDKAIRELSKLVHRHPDQGSLWLTLATILLRLQRVRKSGSAAAKCAHRAMKLGQANMDVTKVLCMVSLASFIIGDYKEALKSAQNALHTYPNVAESWAVFIAVLLALQNEGRGKINYRVGEKIGYVEKHLSPTPALGSWLKKQSDKIKAN